MSEPNFETHTPEVRDGFLWEPIPEGCLLFEENTGKLITLNASAEAVLTHCDGGQTVTEICGILETELQIPSDETRSVLRRLIEEGVISAPVEP